MYDVLVLATRTRQVIDILLFCIVAVLLLFSASVVLIFLMPGYFTQGRTLAPLAWEAPGWQAPHKGVLAPWLAPWLDTAQLQIRSP